VENSETFSIMLSKLHHEERKLLWRVKTYFANAQKKDE